MRAVFFGTSGFAVPTLRAADGFVRRGGGRLHAAGQARGQGPQAHAAARQGLRPSKRDWSVLQPERIRSTDIAEFRPDVGVVAAYGQILSRKLLDVPRLGLLNLHPSLLPRWRGAAPIQRALLEGDAETGVCVMRGRARTRRRSGARPPLAAHRAEGHLRRAARQAGGAWGRADGGDAARARKKAKPRRSRRMNPWSPMRKNSGKMRRNSIGVCPRAASTG